MLGIVEKYRAHSWQGYLEAVLPQNIREEVCVWGTRFSWWPAVSGGSVAPKLQQNAAMRSLLLDPVPVASHPTYRQYVMCAREG